MADALCVRAVVVTFRAAAFLPECLDSLLAQQLPGIEWEVVVVDNGSTDGTATLLARDYPQVRIVTAGRNLGFAGGVDLAVRGFDGDAVVLLNDDATFAPGAVRELLDELFSTPRAGAVTARILLAGRWRRTASATGASPDGASPWEPTPDDEGVELVNSTGNVVRADGSGTDRDWLAPAGSEAGGQEVFGFSGGAAALRCAAVADAGGFDPWLFLYYEDTDLAWRLRARGWTVRYVPQAVAHHRHAASSGATSPLFRYYNTRNSLVVVTRHAPGATVLHAWTRQCAGLTRAALRDGPRAPSTRARARALRDAIVRLPRTLAERRAMWLDAAVSRRDAMAAHSPQGDSVTKGTA